MKKFLYTPGMFFEIPEFQRPYSWQSSNVKEFLADLEECIEKNKKHYFGTVVQVEDTNSSYSNAIIDGQQRVTTSLLMIAAIYHMAKKARVYSATQKLQSNVLNTSILLIKTWIIIE